jgi:3-methyladenine DNA glycosylase AlkD
MENTNNLAAIIDSDMRSLELRNTPNVRKIRRKYTQLLKDTPYQDILEVSNILINNYGYRGLAYELIAHHPDAFASLGSSELELLGKGINSWWSVDSFARMLSGPAWLYDQVPDELIVHWTNSDDRWWRRAALVSTVALNMRSHGGYGDVERTFMICQLLVDDYDDMVVKAMSWALRALVVHDPESVAGFLDEYDDVLAARVKREVRNKLMTGLKNPN